MGPKHRALPLTSFTQKTALVVLGIILAIIFLEVGLRLGGFVLLSMQEYRNRLSVSQPGTYRIMCLGESTTAGQYPRFLEEILNQRNIGIKFSVLDKGMPGTQTDVILSSLELNLDTYHPDMVVTMMGINDDGAHMPYESSSGSKIISFLKSFKTYKLLKLLGMHLARRFDEFRRSRTSVQRMIELGDSYREQYKFSDAEAIFKRAIELDPGNEKAHIGLGKVYNMRQVYRFPEAEKLYKKAIELNPYSDEAYINLGKVCRIQGKLSEAEEAGKEAVAINPGNEQAYIDLGKTYSMQGRFSEAEMAYRKAMEISSEDDSIYYRLGNVYRCGGKYPEAVELFESLLKRNFHNPNAHGALEVFYSEIGDWELSRRHGKEAERLGLSRYKTNTENNYHKLKAILSKRGIRYVCMQYPMRRLEPLKEMFHDDIKNIIFVDNEKIFKEAVQKKGYLEYFDDMFAGDFGHCTQKGNRLLAKNLAGVILKEVFRK